MSHCRHPIDVAPMTWATTSPGLDSARTGGLEQFRLLGGQAQDLPFHDAGQALEQGVETAGHRPMATTPGCSVP
jgi:hypothetical protein